MTSITRSRFRKRWGLTLRGIRRVHNATLAKQLTDHWNDPLNHPRFAESIPASNTDSALDRAVALAALVT
jgi:hypothetical protein